MFLPYGTDKKILFDLFNDISIFKKLELHHIDLISKIKYVDVDVCLPVKHIINIRQYREKQTTTNRDAHMQIIIVSL
jgi:hypothetical protein